MTYRVAASMLEQMFPVDAGKSHETLRTHTLKLGEQLQDRADDSGDGDRNQRRFDLHPQL